MALLPAFKDLELNPDPNAAPIETSEPPTLAEESENQPEPPAIVGEVNTTALTASTATEESENQTETPPNRIAINILGPMYDQLNPDLISHMSTSITDLPHLLGFCPNYINLIHEFLEVVNLLKILKTQKPSTAIRLSQLEAENMEIILEEAKAKELDHSEFSTLLESLHTKITTPNLVFEEILETGNWSKSEIIMLKLRIGTKLSDDLYRFLMLNQKYNPSKVFQRTNRILLFIDLHGDRAGKRKLPPSNSSILLLDQNLKEELIECTNAEWEMIMTGIIAIISEKERRDSDLWKTILDDILPNIPTISHMILLCHFIERRDDNKEEYNTMKDEEILAILGSENALRQFISTR